MCIRDRDAFVQSAKKRGYDILVLDSIIDPHFIGAIEQKLEKVSIKRVDADTIDKLIEKDIMLESVLSKEDEEKLKGIYQSIIETKTATVTTEAMPVDELPIVITFPEFMRRMTDMQAINGGNSMFGNMPLMYTVSVNSNHPLSARILSATEEEQKVLAKQVYDLALLSQGMLSGQSLTTFIQRTVNNL
jgi:molecular chaperone HtpG